MALQSPNFLSAPLPPNDYSGISNLFSNFYKGYEMGQTPQRLAQERLKEHLMNSLLGTQAKYAQPQAEANLQGQQMQNSLNQSKLPFAGQQAEADYLNKLWESKFNEQRNAQEAERFRVSQELSQSQARHQNATADREQQEAEWKKKEMDLLSSDYNAEGGFPMQLMSPGERNDTNKDMRAEQRKAQNLIKVNETAKEMLELIRLHPNIADEMASVWAHADENDPKVWDKIRRKISNKADLAAFEKFRKAASKLVIFKADSMGGRVTDAKLKFIENMKASPGNTDEANKYMLEGEIYDTSPAYTYNKALEKGFNTRRRPALDLEAYREQKQRVDLDNLPDPFK